MRFRIKDLKEFFNGKINWNKVVDELNKKSFETILENDYLEVEILPNRFADAGHLYGLAKEISLLLELKIKEERFKIKEINKRIDDFIKISSKTKGCLNYFARVILDVKNRESPIWLKEFLNSYGLNSINLIVDLSNYVMIKYGAPLHVFDLDKVEKEIIIRESREKEQFHSLKDAYYLLPAGSILITDKKKILALAGIQGAKSAEVNLNTKNILIEAAIFDSGKIYKTSRAINLQTEASYRFERRVSEMNSLKSLEYLTYLIQKNCKGKVAKGYFQLKKLENPPNIVLRYEKINEYLGEDIKEKEILETIKKLCCKIIKKTKKYVYLTPPLERLDLKEEVDLIEEVIRLKGYNNIKTKFPAVFQLGQEKDILKFEDFARDILTSAGIDEVMTYSFISEEDKNNFETLIRKDYENLIEISNPQSQVFRFYRPFIFINLLKAVSKNLSYYNWLRTKDIFIFEIGNVGGLQNNKIRETTNLSICISTPDYKNFYSLGKGILSYLAEKLGLKKFHYKALDYPFQDFNIFSEIHAEEEKKIGFWISLSPSLLRKYDLEQPVFIAELNLEKLLEYFEREKFFETIPTYPAIIRDISLVVSEFIQVDQVENEIFEIAKELLEDIELFDIYQGPPLKTKEKSLSFHLIFRSKKKTLTDEEVNSLMEKIVKRLQEKFGAIIR